MIIQDKRVTMKFHVNQNAGIELLTYKHRNHV